MDPIIVGIIVGLPASVLGWLGYQRSVRLDRLAVQTAALKESGTTTQSIVDGLDRIIKNLQEDNKVLRERVEAYMKQLRSVEEELISVKAALSKSLSEHI